MIKPTEIGRQIAEMLEGVDDEYTLNYIAGVLDGVIRMYGDDMGFALFVYPHKNKSALGKYVSNSKREDITKMMEKFLTDFKEKEKNNG